MSETYNLKLKNQALLERIGELTANYESIIADLRVEITNLRNEDEDNKKQAAEAEVLPE